MTLPRRKYHPGHWVIMMSGNDSQKAMDACLVRNSAGKVIPKGIMKRYDWRSLEPSEGKYDFNEIRSDLEWGKSKGVRITPLFEDKSFRDELPVPDYLIPYTPRSHTPNGQGYTVARWDPFVIERKKAIYAELGEQFDSHPFFEGISEQETSLSLDAEALDEPETGMKYVPYSPQLYRDSYIQLIEHAADVMPTSRFFWHMNFMARNTLKTDYLGAIVQATKGLGNLIMGGPDCLPANSALVRLAYPLYERYQQDIPLFVQMSPDSYRNPEWSMNEMFIFARDELNVNFIMWTYIKGTRPFNYDDAIPVMRQYQAFNTESW